MSVAVSLSDRTRGLTAGCPWPASCGLLANSPAYLLSLLRTTITMHTDIFILQPPAHLHTLSAGQQTAPAALLEGWLWAFPPLLVIIGTLAAKLGVVLTPLTFLPSSPGSSRLVTINLDILLTAALLDGLFGLVWFDCASAPDNTSMFHSTLLSAGIGVLGMALLGFVNIRLVNTLQSLLTPHQRRRKKMSLVTEMGYKPWGMVLIVCFKAFSKKLRNDPN